MKTGAEGFSLETEQREETSSFAVSSLHRFSWLLAFIFNGVVRKRVEESPEAGACLRACSGVNLTMEILLVLLLGYLLNHLQTSGHIRVEKRTRAILLVACLFAAGRLSWTVLNFPNSMYAPEAGLRRDMTCEQVKAQYQAAVDARDPDSFSDEVPFQAQFEVLSNPLSRARYEYYDRTEEDAALKDLFSSLPFYMGGLLLAYGLTCSKESIHAGKWGIILLVLLASIEWRVKSALPQQAEYLYTRFTVHQQLELLKALFYPVLLLLILYSQVRFEIRTTEKLAARNQLSAELTANEAVLRNLITYRAIAEEEIETAVQQNKQRAEELKLSLQQQSPPTMWKKWAWNIGVLALIYYSLSSSNSSQPAPPPGRPPYWKP